MKLLRLTTLVAGVLFVAACDRSPTEPALSADLDRVDPYVLTFNATAGLPGEPFHAPGSMGAKFHPKGLGAPFPDNLRLTDAQKAAIQALVDAFQAANAADLAALKAIHTQAREAMKAGTSKQEVRAILETAKPILERLRPAFDALHTAIQNVLTDAQKAWIASHKPAGPPKQKP